MSSWAIMQVSKEARQVAEGGQSLLVEHRVSSLLEASTEAKQESKDTTLADGEQSPPPPVTPTPEHVTKITKVSHCLHICCIMPYLYAGI